MSMNTILLENIEFTSRSLYPVGTYLLFCRGLRGGSAGYAIGPVFWVDSVNTKTWKWNSTPVENIRQISLFMQNEPNFPNFSPKNDGLTKKRTQTNPNSEVFTGLDINLTNRYIRFS